MPYQGAELPENSVKFQIPNPTQVWYITLHFRVGGGDWGAVVKGRVNNPVFPTEATLAEVCA